MWTTSDIDPEDIGSGFAIVGEDRYIDDADDVGQDLWLARLEAAAAAREAAA